MFSKPLMTLDLIYQVVFIAAIAVMAFIYVGYPALMLALSFVLRRPVRRADITPRVSVIIAAYNEERDIEAKLENSLALDYPRDRMEIIVASDGSTDRTDDIVRAFADRGVRLFRCEGGMGKTAVSNLAAGAASGEILVFSDATGMWNRDAVAEMASHFADPRVGCVSGRVGYRYDVSPASRGFGAYQRYV